MGLWNVPVVTGVPPGGNGMICPSGPILYWPGRGGWRKYVFPFGNVNVLSFLGGGGGPVKGGGGGLVKNSPRLVGDTGPNPDCDIEDDGILCAPGPAGANDGIIEGVTPLLDCCEVGTELKGFGAPKFNKKTKLAPVFCPSFYARS